MVDVWGRVPRKSERAKNNSDADQSKQESNERFKMRPETGTPLEDPYLLRLEI